MKGPHISLVSAEFLTEDSSASSALQHHPNIPCEMPTGNSTSVKRTMFLVKYFQSFGIA